MFSRDRIKTDFSKAAASYDAHALLQRRVLSALLERVKPLLVPDMVMLDAGCGTGQWAKLLQRKDVIQLDISYAMCRKAMGNGNITVNAALESLPFAMAVFDAAVSSLVLQWLPDMQAGLQELRRVVKPGGLIALSTFGAQTLQELRCSFAAYDDFPHVSPFLAPDGSWEHERMTEYFPDLYALMRALKAIGAGNKLLSRRKSMMTPGKMKKIEAYYRQRFGNKNGLPVTWDILYQIQTNR
jgi:malonyl-CoA O-methyltransferase